MKREIALIFNELPIMNYLLLMTNYVTAARSNSILDKLSHLRAQCICKGGGVPDSAKEKS